MNYCCYFQAQVDKSLTWFFVATLRSFEYIAFDRTIDKQKGIFEFFVPKDYELEFLKIMKFYIDENIVLNFKSLPNRLKHD